MTLPALRVTRALHILPINKKEERVTNNPAQGLIKKQALTRTELAAIAQLADICNSYEDLHISFGWLSTRPPGDQTSDFLYYQNGLLIGYLNISSYGTKEKELSGMVHPDYRRKGIF